MYTQTCAYAGGCQTPPFGSRYFFPCWLVREVVHTCMCTYQRRLMKRWETVRLSCTKQMGSARSSMHTTHPFHCPPETLIYFNDDLTVNLVGGANVVCFVSLLIHIAIHTSL